MALAFLMLPLLGASASAEETEPPAEEVTTAEVVAPEGDVLVGEPGEEPASGPTPVDPADALADALGDPVVATQSPEVNRPANDEDGLSTAAIASATPIDEGELAGATYITKDEDGPNDKPGQVDVTNLWLWPVEVGTLKVAWSWDEVDWSGENTGDACALFDTDEDGNANFAVCVTIDDYPAVQIEGSPRVYQCKDTDDLKCFDAQLVPSPQSACIVSQTETDPFPQGSAYSADTTALCEIVLSDVSAHGSGPQITNVCSFPSQIPNSNPFDCVLAPRDALLTIKKVLSPVQPEAQVFDFTVTTPTANGPSPQTVTVSSGEPGESFGIASGKDVTIQEVLLDGWELLDAVCSNEVAADPVDSPIALNLRSGEHVTCVFTNTRTSAVVVDKEWVVNGEAYENGDPALAAYGLSAQLTLTGPGATDATDQDWGVARSGYLTGDKPTIDEANPAITNELCDFVGGRVTTADEQAVDLALPHSPTLSGGDNRFTITNTVTCGAELTLIKSVTAPSVAGDWTLTATATEEAVAGPSGVSGSTAATGPVTPGATYTLSEAGSAEAYIANYVQQGSWQCTDGVTMMGSQVSVPAGLSATCTVTNATAQLTLRKVVVDDDGGTAPASAFKLSATPAVSGPTVYTNVDGSGSGTTVTVKPGVEYTLAETGVAGYQLESLACTRNGAAMPDVDKESRTLTPAANDAIVCTFTNDDVPARLTLLKDVDNGDTGATTPDTAWTLSASGPTTVSGVEGAATVTNAAVGAGTYTLAEAEGHGGYAASAWACTKPGTGPNGTVSVPVADSEVTLGLGEHVTCEVTNTAVAPDLTLVKEVVNESGGTATAAAWTLAATPEGIEEQSVVTGPGGGEGAVVDRPVRVGSYALSESSNAGYDWSSLVCTNDGTVMPGVSKASPTVTLVLGDNVTCTFTNTDRPATLTLRKVVDPNGTDSDAVSSDWWLAAEPQNILGQARVSGSGDPTADDGVREEVVFAGQYVLSEVSGPDGFAQGEWVCEGFATTDTVEGVATVTIPNGADVVCEITNKAEVPQLTLVKSVVNGNTEASADAEDWLLTADGPGDFSVGGQGGVDSADAKVGIYILSESSTQTGYSASSWACTEPGDEAPVTFLVTGGNTIVLAEGDDVTCTITNTAIAPRLTLVKDVVNGDTGAKVSASAWTLTADGPGRSDLAGFGGASGAVVVGEYVLDESGSQAGYTPSDWSCVDPQGSTVPVERGDTVSLGAGDDVTCTIVNTAIAPRLSLVKVVADAGAGGAAEATDWTLEADGPGEGHDLSGPGGASGAVVVGGYDLSENGGPEGYDASDWTCTKRVGDEDVPVMVTHGTVTLALGDDVTCTIINTAIAPHLSLVKVVENGSTGAAYDREDWRVSATGPDTIQGDGTAGAPVSAGSYTLSESGPDGYKASEWVCLDDENGPFPGADGDTVVLELGDDVTCTITNTAIMPKLKLVKVVDNGTTGRTATAKDWTLVADGDGAAGLVGAGGAAGHLPIGDYALSETGGPAGYTASNWQCTTSATGNVVTLGLADDVTCTITNTASPIPPPPPPGTASVKVVKVDDRTGQPIDTARFKLWRDTGTAVGVLDAADMVVPPGEVSTGTGSNPAGSYLWSGLSQGAYLLQETAAPTGYNLGSPTVRPLAIAAADLGTTVTRTVRNPQQPTDVEVLKLDDETGELLAGASFQAYQDTGTTAGVLDVQDTPVGAAKQTGADGTASWSGLLFGSYLFEEISPPPGYGLPEQRVQTVTITAANAGGVIELRFLDPALGTLTLAKAAFEQGTEGDWVASDGQVEFGDRVKYVVTATAEGPKIHRDVVVADYIPGYDPDDTTSDTEAVYVAGSARCVGSGACTVAFDGNAQLLTWRLDDMRSQTRTVEFVIEFPEARDEAVAVEGVHTETLTNTAAATWTDRTGEQGIGSNPVDVEAELVVLPAEEERPPAQPRPPAVVLPETGAPDSVGILTTLGGFLLAVGALLMMRRRREAS